jgi:serine protease AprX
MKNFILIQFFLSLMVFAHAQPLGPAYVVCFSDKNNSPYSIKNPSEFLSQTAIERRAMQGIPIQMDDIPVNANYLQAISDAGVQIAAVSRWFNKAGVWILDENIIPQLEALPFVSSVEPMGDGSKQKKHKPIENKFSPDFGSHDFIYNSVPGRRTLKNYFDYGPGLHQIQMINGVSLHNEGYRGQGMVIAVLDAGFRNVDNNPAFDSLRAHNRILGTRDFVQPGNNVYKPTAHTHGANVLSIMATNLPGQMIGTAPEASYWLLRTEDHDPPASPEYLMEEYFWISGAEFADSVGARVINSSLGYYEFDDPSQNHTYEDLDGNTTPITRAANRAASKGMLVVNSAGNSGSSDWYYIIAPADGFDVLAVGAVTADSTYVSWSSKGPSYDGRVKPDVAAQGASTRLVNSQGNVVTGSGTSYSSPVIAGMAACLWQSRLDQTNGMVYQAIINSASQFLNPDFFTGYGIPDFEQAFLILGSASAINSKKALIRVYPNPVTSRMKIETLKGGDSIQHLTLHDMTGRELLRRDYSLNYQTSVTENLEGFRAGIYLLKVGLTVGSETVKIIKL